MNIVKCSKCLCESINFIDNNNVFVGFDEEQSCCEDVGWFIADKVTPFGSYCEADDIAEGFNRHQFDIKFFQEVEDEGADYPPLQDGGMVAFKLVCEGDRDLYLHLYNAHNGYYSHGFDMKQGETVIHEGLI